MLLRKAPPGPNLTRRCSVVLSRETCLTRALNFKSLPRHTFNPRNNDGISFSSFTQACFPGRV